MEDKVETKKSVGSIEKKVDTPKIAGCFMVFNFNKLFIRLST